MLVSTKLLSRKSLAKKLDVSPRQLDRWRAEGKIPTPAPGPWKQPHWKESEIDAWIEGGCPPGDDWEQMK